jgi:hypothetical protein
MSTLLRSNLISSPHLPLHPTHPPSPLLHLQRTQQQPRPHPSSHTPNPYPSPPLPSLRAVRYARTHEDSSQALSLSLDERTRDLNERTEAVQTLTSEVCTTSFSSIPHPSPPPLIPPLSPPYPQVRLLDLRLLEFKASNTQLMESEKDLREALARSVDRANKAEKEVVYLSEGGASGQRERERMDDLCVNLQKQVRSSVCDLFLSVSYLSSFPFFHFILFLSFLPSLKSS